MATGAIIAGLVLSAAGAGASIAASAGAFSETPDTPDVPVPEAKDVQDARRRTARAFAGRGRGATLLTGPRGVLGPTNIQRKTLLGQ